MLLSMCSFFSHRLFSLFLLLPSATNVFLLLITCTCCYDLTKGTQARDFSYSFFDSLSDRSKEFKTEISHTHSLTLSHTVLIATLPPRVDLWRLTAARIGAVVQELSRGGSGQPSDVLMSPSLVSTHVLMRICLCIVSDSSYSHSHTLLITCTCCYDLTKGTQDKDFSYSFSGSLS